MANELLIRPLGLWTQPNRFGQFPPGAMVNASGIVIRNPGIAEAAPTFATYKASVYLAGATCTPAFLGAPSTMGVLIAKRTSDNHWLQMFFDGTNTFGNDLNSLFPWGNATTFDPVNASAAFFRGRCVSNATSYPIVNDTLVPTSNATAKPRGAGYQLPSLNSGAITAVTTSAGAVSAGNHCGIRYIFRRPSTDGYEIISYPSAALPFYAVATSNISLTIRTVAFTTIPQAGDIVELYRTRQQPLVPGVSGTNIGAVYFLSSTVTLTAAHIAAGFVTVVDTSPDSNLGRELYTNPGQSGSAGAKLPPPYATAIEMFKGYAFYLGRIDRPTIALSVPAGIYSIGTATGYQRQYAIGERSFTATSTSGNATLTAISAADIVGLDVGQVLLNAVMFPVGTVTITAVGATTVTCSTTASASVTQAVLADDVIETQHFDGTTVSYLISQLIGSMFQNFTNGSYALLADELVISPAFTQTTSWKSFALIRLLPSSQFTIRASNGGNYVPALPNMSSTALTVSQQTVPNGIAWSEQGQPESCPAPNVSPVGSGTIYTAKATRDALWIFASDGLWRLTGSGGTVQAGYDWRVDPVDSTLSLSGPHAACVLRDTVYAYTNRGLVAINADGVREISQGRINDLLPGPPFSSTAAIQIAAEETNDEIWLGIYGGSSLYYVYNTLTDAWTTVSGQVSDLVIAYSRALQGNIIADTTTAYKPGTTAQTGLMDYQNVTLDDDPASMKQFQDVEYVFENSTAPASMQPRWAASVTGSAIAPVSCYQDTRARAGVPRIHAIANSVRPGLTISTSPLWRFLGLVVRGVRVGSGGKKR